MGSGRASGPRDANLILTDLGTPTPRGARRRRHQSGDLLASAADEAPVVWFPVTGVLAHVRETMAGGSVGVTVVGREGCLGLATWMGAESQPFAVMSVVGGEADWIPLAEVDAQAGDPDGVLRRYAALQLVELGVTAVCNRLHNALQRTARLLLDLTDRVITDELEVTHEVLGNLLGEQRPHVTVALAHLEHAGAVHRGRGRILIRDRRGLLAHTCECYDLVQRPAQRRQPDRRLEPAGPRLASVSSLRAPG